MTRPKPPWQETGRSCNNSWAAACPLISPLSGEGEGIDTVVPLKRWQEAAFASHPLLAAQEAQVRQAESTLGAERQAWVPDVTEVFHTRDVDLRGTGGGLSIPLPLWNRKEGEVAKTAAAKSQAESELRLLKQDLETRLASQYSLYETARRQVESFRNERRPNLSG